NGTGHDRPGFEPVPFRTPSRRAAARTGCLPRPRPGPSSAASCTCRSAGAPLGGVPCPPDRNRAADAANAREMPDRAEGRDPRLSGLQCADGTGTGSIAQRAAVLARVGAADQYAALPVDFDNLAAAER